MDEKEKKPEEEKPEEKQPAEDTGKGNKPKTPKVIDDANSAAERMEQANEKRELLLQREEELAANRQLGGETEAGGQAPVEKKLSDKEYAEAMERGEANPFKEDGFK